MLQDMEIWRDGETRNSFNRRTLPVWSKKIDELTISVRKEIAKEYDINHGINRRYIGLCDVFTDKFIEEFERNQNDDNIPKGFIITRHHGEMKHNSKLLSESWDVEHTWLSIHDGIHTIYVDGVTCQFKDLFGKGVELPEYYISHNAPPWYYDDKDNPRWAWLPKHFRPLQTVIEFFQYRVYGAFSDNFVRRFLLKRKYYDM